MTNLKHSKERETTTELSAQNDHTEPLVVDKLSFTSLSPYLAASHSRLLPVADLEVGRAGSSPLWVTDRCRHGTPDK